MSTYSAGAEIIREHLKLMPMTPGVYRMLDEKGEALYVGKAKNLKNRVSNYVNPSSLSTRIMRMVSLTTKMEIVQTRTEAEALLLEANLIKELKPRYNILLRDDKSFPYLLMTDHEFPQITKFRGAQKPKGQYFGPFASVSALNETLTVLQKAFLLRPCADTIFKHRTRPCLQHQIKRCSAPCVGLIGKDDYSSLIAQAARFMKGKSREIQDELAREMTVLSESQHYEKAAILRDRIKALNTVQQQQKIQVDSMEDADVIALARSGEKSCVQVFFFRGGQNFGNHSYFPLHDESSKDEEIVSAFIGQFYQGRPAPRLILLAYTLEEAPVLAEMLSLNTPYTVEISVPQRGNKKDALSQAKINAEQSLKARLSEQATVHQLLEGVAELFDLAESPKRIEVYDNSHIMGTHAVGAMILAGPEGFLKKHYRRFNFKEEGFKQDAVATNTSDDYGMMREVIYRRFSRLQSEDADRTKQGWPDLVLIDGGPGQLSSVASIFEELGISDVPFVAISKGEGRNAGREWFYRVGQEPFQLDFNNPVLHYLQRLRDEAHRYAIGSHRAKRAKAISGNPLDAVKGIGGLRKRALMQHFGSAKAVKEASLTELEQVPGISKQIALKIYDHFHEK